MRATKLREPRECRCCGEQFDASDKMADDHGVDSYVGDLYRCGECESLYEDRDEAKECCR